jgi:hypothetical protein
MARSSRAMTNVGESRSTRIGIAFAPRGLGTPRRPALTAVKLPHHLDLYVPLAY